MAGLGGKFLAVVALSAFLTRAVHAENATYGVVIAARAGDQSLFEAARSYCLSAKKITLGNGVPTENLAVFVEGGAKTLPGALEPDKRTILEHLEALSEKLDKSDALWVFIFGHANKTSSGLSIATKGGRLKGAELAESLDAIKGKQFVFALNRQSSAFAPLLVGRANRVVVTATDDDGQLNPPLFPRFLFKAWLEKPKAPLLKILSKAGEYTIDHYERKKLAIAEEPQAFDGAELAPYPFDKLKKGPLAKISFHDTAALSADPSKSKRVAENDASDAEEPVEQDSASHAASADSPTEPPPPPPAAIPIVPPTEETKRAIAKAADFAARHPEFPACYAEYREMFTVNPDDSTDTRLACSIFLNRSAAAERYAKLDFPAESPGGDISIESAKIIFPDGSSANATTASSMVNGRKRLDARFHGTRKGCLIRFTAKWTTPPEENAKLPEFQKTFKLCDDLPIAAFNLEIKIPKKRKFKTKIYNTDIKPTVSEGEYSSILKISRENVPAFEGTPWDPPPEKCLPTLKISSFENWGEFAEWLGRILDGANAENANLRAFAAETAAGAKTDAEKARALYDFLNEIRYETEPIGVGAIRPRPPWEVVASRYGDCKDKANALAVMAKTLGIDAETAFLNRGGDTDTAFPAFQFNHAIVFFPKLDGFPNGLWCDPTDGSTPFGALPPGDVGRPALILENGKPFFKIVALPNGGGSKTIFNAEFDIAPDLSFEGTVEISYANLASYGKRRALKHLSPLETRLFLQKILNASFPGIELRASRVKNLADTNKPLEIEMECAGRNWKTVRARAAFPYDIWAPVAARERNRLLLLNDGQPLRVSWIVSASNDPLAPPNTGGWKKNTANATFSVKTETDGKSWTRKALLDLRKTEIPAADYAAFRQNIGEFIDKTAINP